MSRAITCLLGGRVVGVDEAVELRDGARQRGLDTDFRCEECHLPVRPHRAGGHSSAHFEHLSRNTNCQRSDAARG